MTSKSHAAVDSWLAAARSRNQINLPFVGCTSFEGYFSAGALPSKTSCRTAALSAPLTRNATQRDAFNAGSVNVIRLVFSFFYPVGHHKPRFFLQRRSFRK